jgi:hypothetical protein
VGVEQLIHKRDRDSVVRSVAESGWELREWHVDCFRRPGVHGPMSEDSHDCRDRLDGAVMTLLVTVGLAPTVS